MLDNHNNKLKTQSNHSNSYNNHITAQQHSFGKPFKLPYINRNNIISLDRKSLQDKNITHQQQFYHYSKKYTISNHSNLILTLDEIQLCNQINNRSITTQFKSNSKLTQYPPFPKINTIQPSQRIPKINSQKNIPKMETLEVVNGYKIGSVIGRGTYAIVRMGRNLINNKKIAIKTYHKSKMTSDLSSNLQREINNLRKLTFHPNILKFQTVIETSQSTHIITELLHNTSLTDFLKAEGRKKLSQLECQVIAKQLLQGLNHIHQFNICHRDLKMENILIRNMKVKIIDFGFSLISKQDEVLWQVCGSPHYMAPQILNKKGYKGKPVDVWALGVIFYKLITGQFPFKAINQKSLYLKIMKGQFKMSGDIPIPLTYILNQMLNINPEHRPSIRQLLTYEWFQGTTK